ncbi:MAG: hypothetical protein ABI702_13705 [Burkholderiales bacterium]
MNDAQRPTSYGVFKPVGHVVMAFPTAADSDRASSALIASGFGATDITAHTPAQMLEQAERDVAQAGTLAGLGQELNLVKAHGELARQGSSFLVVRARTREDTATLTQVALHCHASRAQHYGRLVIEELIPVGGSDHQVAESTDRGLDAQTTSGAESARSGGVSR